MPPLSTLLVQTLNDFDLPVPPGVTPTAVPAPPIATPIATPIVSPSASPFATPLVETTASPAATPAVPPLITQPDGGVDGWLVILVVVVVLGAVVLIAWLLKPLVVRRLAEEEAVAVGGITESSEPPGDRWTRDLARRDTETSLPAVEAVPASDAPSGEIATPDVAEMAPEPATTVEPAIIGTGPVEDVPSSHIEQPDDSIDAGEIVGITLTVRELLEFANAGQLLRGFDLYSESYLQRFRAETGLTDEQFAEEYGAISAPAPEARVELAAVTGVEDLPDGRVSALISFGNGGAPVRPERFVFVRIGDRWLIDDITSAG
jgi:hypothetical protein